MFADTVRAWAHFKTFLSQISVPTLVIIAIAYVGIMYAWIFKILQEDCRRNIEKWFDYLNTTDSKGIYIDDRYYRNDSWKKELVEIQKMTENLSPSFSNFRLLWQVCKQIEFQI